MKQFTKILLVIFCFTNSLLVFAQKSDSQLTLLTKAYKKNSAELMTEFFRNWAKEVPPMSEVEFLQLNDTIKEVYNFISQTNFRVFYNELDIIVVDTIYFSTMEEVDDYILEEEKQLCEWRRRDGFSPSSCIEKYEKLLERKMNGERLFSEECDYTYYNNHIMRDRYDRYKEKTVNSYKITNFRPFIPNQNEVYICNDEYRKIIRQFVNEPQLAKEAQRRRPE